MATTSGSSWMASWLALWFVIVVCKPLDLLQRARANSTSSSLSSNLALAHLLPPPLSAPVSPTSGCCERREHKEWLGGAGSGGERPKCLRANQTLPSKMCPNFLTPPLGKSKLVNELARQPPIGCARNTLAATKLAGPSSSQTPGRAHTIYHPLERI